MSNALMTNEEIIELEANKKGFAYDGENICTFAQWERKGFSVIRGQRAFIQTYLWTEGKNMRFVIASLYTNKQVVYNQVLENNGKIRKPRQFKDEDGYYLVSKQRSTRELIMV